MTLLALLLSLNSPTTIRILRILLILLILLLSADRLPTNPFILKTIKTMQTELLERKAFLSESKGVLLGATDALDGQKTRNKMAQDDRSVSEPNEGCIPRTLLDALGCPAVVPTGSRAIDRTFEGVRAASINSIPIVFMMVWAVLDCGRLCALHFASSLGSGNVQVSQQGRLGRTYRSGTRQHGTHSGSTVASSGKRTNGPVSSMEGWTSQQGAGCIPHASRIVFKLGLGQLPLCFVVGVLRLDIRSGCLYFVHTLMLLLLIRSSGKSCTWL